MYKFSPNTYSIEDNCAIFEAKNGGFFKIDVEDISKVINYGWGINKKGYVVASSRHRTKEHRTNLRLHRVITNCPENMVVDHINHDTLDNRKCNLRICSQNENIKNRKPDRNSKSGIKGVYPEKGRWKAIIGLNSKLHHLGTFRNIEDAIKARQEAEKMYYGEFANIQEVKL